MNIRRMTISVALSCLLSGCGAFQTLGDRTEEAVEAGINPEEREIHYLREGNVRHYFRRECTGKFCEEPER